MHEPHTASSDFVIILDAELPSDFDFEFSNDFACRQRSLRYGLPRGSLVGGKKQL